MCTPSVSFFFLGGGGFFFFSSGTLEVFLRSRVFLSRPSSSFSLFFLSLFSLCFSFSFFSKQKKKKKGEKRKLTLAFSLLINFKKHNGKTGNDRVVVQDYKKGTATFIDGPNATHPLGSCDVIKFDELPGGADAATSFGGGGGGGGAGAGGEKTKAKDSANAAADGSAPVAAGFSSPSSSSSSKPKREDAFLPTAAALAFAPGGGAARAKFLPSASFDVRGIPVETWARRVEEKASNSSFDLLYFFPVNAWLASGEDYHRLLKAIVVNGTQNGQRVYQEFHFVDFRPYSGGGGGGANGTGIPAEAFDPCEIAPGGAGCGCEKRKKSAGGDNDGSKSKGAKAAADFAAFPAGASGGVPSPPRDFSERQQTMGFLPSQVGSYVFFLFLGLVAGLLGAFGVPALHSCCCARRRRSFGRFEEGNGGAAPTSAVTSAA